MFEFLWLQLLIGVIIGAWIASNARDRGEKTEIQILLFVVSLLFGIFALIGYFLFRPKKK